MKKMLPLTALCSVLALASTAQAQVPCLIAGPQTPRDVASKIGSNTITWPLAPASTQMNLCDIHTHTNAEHKGPGFSVFVNDSDHGGYACNETADLTAAELAADPSGGTNVKSGETIEVHWVHTSCPVDLAASPPVGPAPGLGSCLCSNANGSNPVLRVETQVFLVVNDPAALDFSQFAYDGNISDGYHQPKSLPTGTGVPLQFLGSTTGPSFNDTNQCSPFKATWSVRPKCAKVHVSSVNAWFAAKDDPNGTRADGSINVFKEDHSHGVRQLVANSALLSKID